MKNKPMSDFNLPYRRAFVGISALIALTTSQVPAQAQDQNQPGTKLSVTEARTMAEGLKPLLNDSAEGLVFVKHADGSVSTDLQGRFQNVTVAVKDASGAVTQGCVNNTEAAAAFFGIDRQLFNLPAKTEATKTDAPKTEAAKPADR